MAVALENMVRDLRDELRGVTKLNTSVEALVLAVSDLRDAIIRSNHLHEEILIALREQNRKG